MTTASTLSRSVLTLAATVVLSSATGGALSAQAKPANPAASAPKDSQPVPIALTNPSPPPSVHAPRAAVVRQVQRVVAVDSTTGVKLAPKSLPVDSVRPKGPKFNAVDPKRAPAAASPLPPRAGAETQAVAPIVAPPVEPPVGSTAQCKDGTWIMSAYNDASCSAHNGLLVRFPVRSPPPPRPPRP
jgi:hypothetical protein